MICTWNVRGINKEARHRKVKSYLNKFNVPVVGLLETRVKQHNADRIRRKFGNKWMVADNYAHHENGRIWLMWNFQEIELRIVQLGEQYIHAEVSDLNHNTLYCLTVVYACNQLEKRKVLWNVMESLGTNNNHPWIAMGDFNNVITTKDRFGGNSVTEKEYRDLSHMMHTCGLYEAETRGGHFTWSNNHTTDVIYSRIDHMLGNLAWFQRYPEAIVEVLAPSISDHAPIRVRAEQQAPLRRGMFKFLNCITQDPSYTQVVKDSWKNQVPVTAMHRLWSKLRRLQTTLKPLIKKNTDIQRKKNRQTGLHILTALDGRRLSTRESIEEEILEFYTNLVGTKASELKAIDITAIRGGKMLTRDNAHLLIKPVHEDEIWKAIQSLGDTKAPCIDGFTAHFFKKSWMIIRVDVIEAMQEFFRTSKMHKAVNCSFITLIPKSSEARTVKDMRPISCCTTIYKVISKILTARLGMIIDTVVDDSQSAFIPGKVIHDNIMLAQESVRGYNRKNLSPRCMIQVDIQKAYDTVDWDALQHIMIELGFPHLFVNWIMACVRNVSYRFSLNGSPTGILQAKRGLRQGDPISPLLFVLVMEYLHRVLQTLVHNPIFKFHPNCDKLRINILCFADDLLLFVKGDLMSIKLLMSKFREFSAPTGLLASPSKSKVYFGGGDIEEQNLIQQETGFVVGHMPFKYLGKETISRKALVSWEHTCDPISAGGMNLIDLSFWNRATMCKMLWNICGKKDVLWIRWVHMFYIRNRDVDTYQPNSSCSWILKAVFKYRDLVLHSPVWTGFKSAGAFVTRKMYDWLRGNKPRVSWRNLIYVNKARPRALFTLWLACQNRLLTKERLNKIGVTTDGKCVLCGALENSDHLFFLCTETRRVWQKVLGWIRIMRVPVDWQNELCWICSQVQGKSNKARVLKIAITETICHVWQ
ncbi:uncharacterized protein LOC131636928 [Vicia villosa]|uniref:uncharacterized protein LOC131636928 n=1 Tax=Vicia villosa TaxID=3911 RepID=UPI00273C580D|nr:uncharacterized protein LOC131636928 [Vicia villosa]